MVAIQAKKNLFPRVRWLGYLTLSLFISLAFAYRIDINTAAIPIPAPELLKVNLLTLAAPKPEPIKQIIQAEPAFISPSPAKTKKVVTEKLAEKKISKPEITPFEKPTLKPKPVPKKQIANKTETRPIIKEITPPTKTALAAKETPIKPAPIKTATSDNAKGMDKTTVIQDAKYRKQMPPSYPRRALELGQQGNVTLHALVKPDGFPSELKIMQSSGHSLLDKAALAAVRKWEFEPTNENGIAVTSWVRVPIEFVIQ